MVSMAIMVASFRQSLDDWLIRVLPADMYVRAGQAGDTAFFSAVTSANSRICPACVASISCVRKACSSTRRGHASCCSRATSRAGILRVHCRWLKPSAERIGDPLPGGRRSAAGIWVSEAVADLYGFNAGRQITLPLAGRNVAFVVAGVWRDYARQQGAIVMERAVYAALTGDTSASDAALTLDNGTGSEDVRRELEARLGTDGQLTFAVPGEIRNVSLQVFDRTFAVTYALEAAAVGIGLVGLSSSFGALVFARRREFGMLRHVGLTRRQVAQMLATEGLAVSGIGLIVGMALGWLMSLILIFVVNRQSFHWSMDLHVPWGSLLVLAIVLLTLATATTLASARGAMGGDAIRAVKDDW